MIGKTQKAAFGLAFALALASIALGDQPGPGRTKYGGTMDITFAVRTRPGGETVQLGNAVASPFNVGVVVSARGVKVNKDGSFSFEARGNYHLDYRATGPGVTIQTAERRADLVRGKGQLAEDAALSLNLEWKHGEGLLVYNTNLGGSSARQPATEAVPLVTWTLTPVSRQVEEIGKDCRRETVKYGASRPSKVVGTQTVPLTDRIQIKHVHNQELVPRG